LIHSIYMNKFLSILLGFVVINLIFWAIPFLVPRLPGELIIPYQLWANSLVVFALILPKNIGSFAMLYNE
jgi:hypothetical protein